MKRRFLINGRNLHVGTWLELQNMSLTAFTARLASGMTPAEALGIELDPEYATGPLGMLTRLRVDDVEKSLGEWAEALGISYHTVIMRLRAGMRIRDAVTRPRGNASGKRPGGTRRLLAVNGEERTVEEWAKLCNVEPSTVLCRIKRGIPPETAVSAPKFAKSVCGGNAGMMRICLDGKIMNERDAAQALGLTPSGLSRRLSRGWKPEDLLRPKGHRRGSACF